MKLEFFLERYVEGYLFDDLATMAPITRPEGKEYGAVGYPMISTTLAGIELLGALTYDKRFNPHEGEKHFQWFWEQRLYKQPPRRDLCPTIYQLLRHGLAHVSFAKGSIMVYKGAGPTYHLVRHEGRLFVEAIEFAQDLRRAYDNEVKPFIGGDLGAVMTARLGEMLGIYASQSEKFFEQQMMAAQFLGDVGSTKATSDPGMIFFKSPGTKTSTIVSSPAPGASHSSTTAPSGVPRGEDEE